MRILAAIVLAISAAACVSTPAPNTGPVSSIAPAGAESFGFAGAGSITDAILRPNDTISVIVAGESNLSLPEVKIAQDGHIMVPAVGRVGVAGMTTEQVAADIEGRLGANYLLDPHVAVNLVAAGSRFVTVEGAVNDPGIFTFEPNTTLLGAVALANGASRLAKRDQIVLFRTIDGQPMAARFHLDQLRSGGMIDPVLMPQDRVVVGVSGASRAFQDILTSLPLMGIFRPF